MKFIYPVCFYSNEGGYTVEALDLTGCVTERKSILEAIDMAAEVESGWGLRSLDDVLCVIRNRITSDIGYFVKSIKWSC